MFASNLDGPRKGKVLGGFCAGVLVAAGSVSAAIPIPGLFNTGVDANGVPLTDNTPDTHYQLIEPSLIVGTPVAATSAGGFPIGPWLGDNALSAWIVPGADTNGPGGDGPSYIYRTSFDLTGLDASRARIAGQWASDNAGLDILLNGVSTGITNPAQFGAFTSFVLNGATHPFTAGVNTLDFVVNNGAGEPNPTGPTGVRVEMRGTIPDPPRPGEVALALFNSGVDASGTAQAPGAPDPHWNVVISPDPVFPTPSPAVTQQNHPAWVANTAGASWISITPQGTTNVAAGTYAFETTFEIPAELDASTVIINGAFNVDNLVSSVLVNGVAVAGISGGGFTSDTEFSLNSGFVSGLNSIAFVMENAPQAPPNPPENPGGIRIVLSGSALPVPEPGSLAMLGMLGVLALRRRQAQR